MGLFSKRKVNKNAKPQPKDIVDYWNSTKSLGGLSGTAFACMDRIATEFGMLNYAIYDTETKQKVKNHKLYTVLKEPNAEDRHYNFFYQSAMDYFNGGCYWLKSVFAGDVISLFRLNPKQVYIKRDENNRRTFCYNGKVYTDKEIVFIPSRFDFSTLTGGKSIFYAAQETFDTAKSLESFTQTSFTNGVVGNRILIDVSQAYPDLTPELAKQLKQSFQNEYAGIENAGRPILKQKGIEYSELKGSSATDNQAAELTKNREFQEHEIAKVFGVPVELLNGSVASNLENSFTMFAEFAVRPMATQFQEAINSLLDEDRFFFEFDYNGIMKVSMQNRIDCYVKQINNGLLSPNEARSKENLEPIEAGENHFMPVNLMPLNDETINAYMAKQKKEIAQTEQDNDQHFGGGDDKQ